MNVLCLLLLGFLVAALPRSAHGAAEEGKFFLVCKNATSNRTFGPFATNGTTGAGLAQGNLEQYGAYSDARGTWFGSGFSVLNCTTKSTQPELNATKFDVKGRANTTDAQKAFKPDAVTAVASVANASDDGGRCVCRPKGELRRRSMDGLILRRSSGIYDMHGRVMLKTLDEAAKDQPKAEAPVQPAPAPEPATHVHHRRSVTNKTLVIPPGALMENDTHVLLNVSSAVNSTAEPLHSPLRRRHHDSSDWAVYNQYPDGLRFSRRGISVGDIGEKAGGVVGAAADTASDGASDAVASASGGIDDATRGVTNGANAVADGAKVAGEQTVRFVNGTVVPAVIKFGNVVTNAAELTALGARIATSPLKFIWAITVAVIKSPVRYVKARKEIKACCEEAEAYHLDTMPINLAAYSLCMKKSEIEVEGFA